MTITEAKALIRTLMKDGISKADAFSTIEKTMRNEYEAELDKLTRFRYELNAEEQRNQRG